MAKTLQQILSLREGYGNDDDAVHELHLHADNDSHLYHSSKVPIMKNLEKKKAKGVYDHAKATKLWGYHADRAAQSYHQQHGDKHQHWSKAWPTSVRKAAAKAWADHWHEHGE